MTSHQLRRCSSAASAGLSATKQPHLIYVESMRYGEVHHRQKAIGLGREAIDYGSADLEFECSDIYKTAYTRTRLRGMKDRLRVSTMTIVSNRGVDSNH